MPVAAQNQPQAQVRPPQPVTPTPAQPQNQPAAQVKPAAPIQTPAQVKSPVVPPGQIKPPMAAPLRPPQPPQAAGAQGAVPQGAAAPKPAVPTQPAPIQAQNQSQAQARPVVPMSPQIRPAMPIQPTPQVGQPPVAAKPIQATTSPTAAAAAAKPTLTPSAVAPVLASVGGVSPQGAALKPVAPAPTAAAGLPKPGTIVPAPVSPAGTPAGSAPQAGQPLANAVKKPPFLLFALIGVVILAAIGFAVYSFFFKSTASQSVSVGETTTNGTKTTGSKTTDAKTTPKPVGKQTTVTYWGLWEPTEVLTQVITDFETANPQYKIDYRKQSHRDYRERLQTAIASGNGPDLFRFHATWTPMLQDELAAMPLSVMSETDYKTIFYPVAAKQLSVQGKIVGIPLMYDGLALFYNKDILKTANAEAPQTWAELRTLADSLTVPSDKNMRGNAPLQRSGMAIGNVANVEHFADILGLLILQNGGDLTKPNSPEVRDALLFYTNFIKEDMVWSSSLPSSTVAFARGDVAMMLAPSWRIHDVKNLNPNLNFGIAPAPKLGDTRLGWASYWAEGVNSKSKNQEGAWAFLKYLSSAEVMKKLYSEASTVRSFGEIYSRQDLAKELNGDEMVSQFLVDAPSADGWFVSSFTHDSGINDQLIKYYADAVNGILEGKTIDEVLQTVDSGTTQVLKQYNVK